MDAGLKVSRLRHARARARLSLIALVGLTLVLAACGSSKSSSSSSSAAGTSSAAAQTTSASSSSSGGSGVAAAAAGLTAYEKTPTKINVTTPLKTAPPKGKVVVQLGTSQPQNVEIQKQIKQIADLAGWTYDLLDYDPANPATFASAINTAIQKHANYVEDSGTPFTPQELSQLSKAHVEVAALADYPLTVKPPVISDPDSFANLNQLAKPVADYFVSNSDGKGVALVEHVPAYAVLDGFTVEFYKLVKQMCPGCKTKEVDITIPQIEAGQTASVVISALRKDPAAKYVVFDDGPWADGFTSALSGAGLNGKVQVIGEGGDPDSYAGIRAGTETMWSGFYAQYSAMQVMDAMFRNSEGMPVPQADLVQPTQAILKSNVSVVQGGNWYQPATSLKQFETLWKLG